MDEVKRNKTLVKNIFLLYFPLLFLGIFFLFPFFWMAITSIKPDRELYNLTQSPFVVIAPTLEHFTYLFTKMPFLTWMRNSFIAAGCSTLVSLVIGSLAGYSIARLRFPGASAIGMGIFITYLVPRTLLFLPLAHVLRSLGLANSVISLVVTYPTFLVPFCTWILMGYFATIPKEIEECAIIDGCSRMGAFVKIVLPLATPGIIAAGVFAFTLSWTEFVYALSFIQLESQKVLTVGVVGQLVKGDVFLWGSLMATALMASIPLAVIYGVLQRHFISGLTAGAVKY